MARNKFDVDETLETPFNIKHLLRAGVYIGRHKKKMILSLLFSAISAACSLVGPMLIQRAIDVSVPNKDYTELIVLAVVMLVAIMVLVGAAMVWRYVSDKRRDTTPIKATIVDVLKYQRGQKKKFSQPSIAYYPILKYEWKGQERTMRSHYNASTASAYKVGTEKTLYWDNARKCILERGPRIGILIGGIAFLAFSLLGIISTIVSL